MTALNLDLSASREKVRRAFKHVKELQGEDATFRERNPHAVSASDIDPDSGWCTVKMHSPKGEELRLSVIVGDVVHNLRSALDYVIAGLVDAAGTPLSTKHQFPVCRKRRDYEKEVARGGVAHPDGPLADVRHGLGIIEGEQPYNHEPHTKKSLLWGINRFSNADKHREPLGRLLNTRIDSLYMDHNGTKIAETQNTGVNRTSWKDEVELAQFQFARPYPTEMNVQVTYFVLSGFRTPAFVGHTRLTYSTDVFWRCCEYVDGVLDAFERL